MTLETVNSTQDVDIWMEIPIQKSQSQKVLFKVGTFLTAQQTEFNTTYIWANYSVSSYLSFIPICWNVLIWLKYDFMHIFMHHLSLYFDK